MCPQFYPNSYQRSNGHGIVDLLTEAWERDKIEDYTFESGYRMTLQALAKRPRPTALLAANNRIAFGMLRALRKASTHSRRDLGCGIR